MILAWRCSKAIDIDREKLLGARNKVCKIVEPHNMTLISCYGTIKTDTESSVKVGLGFATQTTPDIILILVNLREAEN